MSIKFIIKHNVKAFHWRKNYMSANQPYLNIVFCLIAGSIPFACGRGGRRAAVDHENSTFVGEISIA